LKARLFIAAGTLMLSLCVFLIYFYSHMNVETAVSSGNDLYSFGCVPYLDSFLCIDMNGKVLSVARNANKDAPVIVGLEFDQFSVGGCLNTKNNDAFGTIAYLLSLFRKYNLDTGLVNKIDVANLNDIHLYTKNVYVAFGSTQDADAKIRTLKEIIADLQVAEGVKGILDIRVIGRQYIFTVLT